MVPLPRDPSEPRLLEPLSELPPPPLREPRDPNEPRPLEPLPEEPLPKEPRPLNDPRPLELPLVDEPLELSPAASEVVAALLEDVELPLEVPLPPLVFDSMNWAPVLASPFVV